MSKNYEQIATVSISVSETPIVDSTSFKNVLLIGKAPTSWTVGDETNTSTSVVAKYAKYTSLSDVTNAGWQTTDDIYKGAAVAFSQSPRPDCIYIAPIIVTNSESENLSGAISRCLSQDGWYVACPCISSYDTDSVYGDDGYMIDAFGVIEESEKMLCYSIWGNTVSSNAVLPAIDKSAFKIGTTPTLITASEIASKDYSRIICVEASELSSTATVSSNNYYMNVAFATNCLGYETGSETWAFKQLKGVSTSDYTKSEMEALASSNISYFIKVGDRSVSMGAKVLNGEWIDVIRFMDWLKNDMQVKVCNLFVLNPKVPFTDAGITLVENQIIASLKEGQTRGGICEDEWDEDGNRIPGYNVSVPKATSLTENERKSRQILDANAFTFNARIAGALHYVEINGKLTYANL